MSGPPPDPTAEELRARARELYRRSDNVPLFSGDDRAAIERVGDLREEADRLMARADELDGGS
jgi:hypothetical protein